MSLPLTRRIAKTVLLTAAGAASVVGTAGAASAAELPTTTDVGGLSHPDSVGGTVGSAADQGTEVLSPKGGPVKAPQIPAAGVSAGTDNSKAAPEAARLVGDTANGAREGMTKQTPNVQRNLPKVKTKGLPTDNAVKGTPARSASPQGAGTNVAGQGLSTSNLPTNNLLPGNPVDRIVSIR